jgi:hypothetical protein
VVHRRHAEQHRRAVAQRRRRAGGVEAPEVAQLAAAAQRAEQPEAQASASASRLDATARRDSTAPLGRPVVPDV